jgi:hypothetical protein
VTARAAKHDQWLTDETPAQRDARAAREAARRAEALAQADTMARTALNAMDGPGLTGPMAYAYSLTHPAHAAEMYRLLADTLSLLATRRGEDLDDKERRVVRDRVLRGRVPG